MSPFPAIWQAIPSKAAVAAASADTECAAPRGRSAARIPGRATARQRRTIGNVNVAVRQGRRPAAIVARANRFVTRGG